MSLADARPDRLPARKPEVPAEGQIDSLGALLRARREQLGWSLPEVAGWLRIRQSYLEALETGHVGTLPGTAYALGFLRSYAHGLGLDEELVVQRFRKETRGGLSSKTELSFPQPVSDRTIPLGVWIGAGLAVVIMTYVGYYHFSGGQFAPAQSVPAASEVMPGVTSTAPNSPQVASVMPDRGAAPSTPRPLAPSESALQRDHTALPPPSPGATSDSGSPFDAAPVATSQSGSASQHDTGDQPTASGEVAGQGRANDMMPPQAADLPPPSPGRSAESVTEEASPAALPSPDGSVTLHAIADAWVSIRDNSGKSLLNRVLKTGETWAGSASGAPYHVTVGNAGGVTLSTGSVTTSPLGRSGEVRRNLTVSAEAIEAGAFASEPGHAGIAQTVPQGAAGDTHDAVPPPVPPQSDGVLAPASPRASTESLNQRQLDQSEHPR